MPAGVILTAKVGPNTYNLSDGTIAWRILDDNLAMTPLHRIEEKGPLQDGVTDLTFRLDPRYFQLVLKTQGTSLANLYDRRAQIINIFKPLKKTPIILNYLLPNGAVRQIDTYMSGELKMDETAREGFLQTAVISLKAPDPTFYDPNQVSINYGITTGGVSGAVPLAIPMPVGSSVVNQTVSISYPGSWPGFPTILVYGPLTDPIINNLSTAEKLDLTGLVLIAGDIVTIDTRFGYKTIKDQNGVSKLSFLSNDSNLATFHLDVDPIAPSGNNSIKVNASGAGTATQIYLQFYPRYVGI